MIRLQNSGRAGRFYGSGQLTMTFQIQRKHLAVLFPLALLLLSALGVWKWSLLTDWLQRSAELQAIYTLLPYGPYVVLVAAAGIAWRFNNTGVLLTVFALGVAYWLFSLPAASTRIDIYRIGTAIVLPINILLFSLLARRRILGPAGIACAVVVGLQTLLLVVIAEKLGTASAAAGLSAGAKPAASFLDRISPIFSQPPLFDASFLSPIALCSFGLAAPIQLVRWIRFRQPVYAMFFWVIVASFLTLAVRPSAPALILYTSAAAILMIGAIVETSFTMAYHDELTGLPGRRSLNEALMDMGRKYAIAMIDVDHFKKFNDTYGHDTGDQVLKLIASKLGKMTGGARVYRYGGEEFTALFPGKSVPAAKPFLDSYREDLASTPFVVRGKGRRKGDPSQRNKTNPKAGKTVKITVSIGVAGPDKKIQDPKKVIKAADKALYRAKKRGRIRVAT